MDGFELIPYNVWVELKFKELMDCAMTSKGEEDGGGVGVGSEDDGLLHFTKEKTTAEINSNL